MSESVLSRFPVMLVTGYSGSGKTTLIERLVSRLGEDGLTVAVIKHDTHGLHVDRPGKDSDRFFQAGATVIAHGPNEAFFRVPPARAWDLQTAALHLLRSHDIVLVEGHKQTPIEAKIWLRSDADEPPPPEASDAVMDLSRSAPRFEQVYQYLRPWIEQQWRKTPVRAGFLIGGHSSRMGRPKHLLSYGTETWAERIAFTVSKHVDSVVVLGAGELPSSLNDLQRLSDAPEWTGPLAGMRAAMRWDPLATWIFVACDMPLVSGEAVEWLLGQRAPGRWAVLPRRDGTGQVEPLFACYDYRAGTIIEHIARPKDIASWPHAFLPPIPRELQNAWDNFNTRQEAAAIS